MTHGTVRLSRHLQVFPSLTGQLAEAALPQRRESGEKSVNPAGNETLAASDREFKNRPRSGVLDTLQHSQGREELARDPQNSVNTKSCVENAQHPPAVVPCLTRVRKGREADLLSRATV